MLLENFTTTWSFSVDGSGTPGVDHTTNITNPFPTDALPSSSLLIGITQDLENDAPGQMHVVLMMDDTAASLGANIAWGTLFRNTDEDQLIANIQLATSSQEWAVIQPGLNAVGAFAASDATDGILDHLAQPHSAWFATGGDFTVMDWSDGNIIGSGTSQITIVPESATLPTLAVAGLHLLARRRAE